jgi:uncharacterized protein
VIHSYSLHGDNIIIDAGGGSVHIVDDAARDAITALGGGRGEDAARAELAEKYGLPQSELDELFADIAALSEDGKLFAPDVTDGVARRGDGAVKALCLHIAHSCNMRCDYCFAGQGKYRGADALMSFDVARAAIDFLVRSSGSRRNLEVDFFGGEPLLNFGVVKRTVEYARSLEEKHGKLFRFTLTTNGLLLDDEITEYANREMSNVVLSLDGRRGTHDARRRVASGGGSYGEVVPRFLRFAERRGDKSYYIRGTYTRENTDFLNDILHIADLGFAEIAMEPAVLPRTSPLALRESDLPELFAQYESLALEMAARHKSGENEFEFYHYMLDLENGPCAVKRAAGCGAGSEYFAVTPDGTLYPCHQLAGESGFEAGGVADGVRAGYGFGRGGVNSRAECKDCWAKLWCAGGCASNAYRDTGDINGVHEFGCVLFRKRLECAVWLAAQYNLTIPDDCDIIR